MTILSNSRSVATLHLSSNVGRDVLGIPIISRHLFLYRLRLYLKVIGKPSHNGDAYSSGSILVQCIVMPRISDCR